MKRIRVGIVTASLLVGWRTQEKANRTAALDV